MRVWLSTLLLPVALGLESWPDARLALGFESWPDSRLALDFESLKIFAALRAKV